MVLSVVHLCEGEVECCVTDDSVARSKGERYQKEKEKKCESQKNRNWSRHRGGICVCVAWHI